MAATLVICGAIVIWVYFVREPYDEPALGFLKLGGAGQLKWASERLVWAILQQIVLQTFIWPLFLEITGRGSVATLCSAIAFSLFHLPSPVLALLTFITALVWLVLYRRGRRLAPLILAHWILAATGQVMVPERLHYDMRVGVDALKDRQWYQMLGDEKNRAILRSVTSNDYFTTRGGTDEDFVIGLYEDILGRTPARSEVEFWLGRLDDQSRATVAKHFVKSDELIGLQDEFGHMYRFPFRKQEP